MQDKKAKLFESNGYSVSMRNCGPNIDVKIAGGSPLMHGGPSSNYITQDG